MSEVARAERAASSLTLLRFDPTDPVAWARWPVLERRIRTALADLCPDTNAEAVLAFVRERLRLAPASIAVWCVEDAGTIVGHVVAFCDIAWQEPYVLVHEAVMDRPVRSAMLGPWLRALRAFVDEINARYTDAQSHLRVKKIQFWTPRDSAAFDRYFRNPETGESRVHSTLSVKTIRVEDL